MSFDRERVARVENALIAELGLPQGTEETFRQAMRFLAMFDAARERPNTGLTTYETLALIDINKWRHGLYRWRPSSMQKLEERGLVERVPAAGKTVAWRITSAGERVCKATQNRNRVNDDS